MANNKPVIAIVNSSSFGISYPELVQMIVDEALAEDAQ